MTLRRNVGSSRSVLASSSVPARTRWGAGAIKSSGSSECATSPSWHQQRVTVANKRGPPGYLYCGAGCRFAGPLDEDVISVADARAPIAVWRSVRALPEFWRLLELRTVSQFGDGLFQAGLAGAILFNPDRAATPLEIAGAFAVLFLPYSVLGPFAGALLDRWDRRLVLIAANLGRLLLVLGVGTLLAVGTSDLPILFGALVVNGFTRFVSSGLSAALPDVVPGEQVVTMNSVATATGSAAAFIGANFMLLPRWLFGADDTGAAAIIFIVTIPVGLALLLSVRFPPHILGPHESKRSIHGSVAYAVATGWLHGARTVLAVPTVAATLLALAAHR